MRSISQVGACPKDRGVPSHFLPRPHYLRSVALQFEKWEGTGNDFVLVDGRQEGRLPSEWSAQEIAALCDREQGIGSDGVVVVQPHGDGSLHVDFRNPDGSRSFCGNGTRSALAWAHQEGLVGLRVALHAIDGLHEGQMRGDGTPGITMNVAGAPAWKDPHMEGASHAAFLDTGSPHHMEWLSQLQALEALDLVAEASPIRHHGDYAPDGCNVNVLVATDAALHIRTFERGVEAETLSCGTGVVASALADIARGDAPSGVHQRNVQARGGLLEVTATVDGHGAFSKVWLHGAAKRMFKGTYTLALALLALWHAPALAGDLADQLTDDARVSVLTASPGSDLYAAFGHTAIRVFDPSARLDYVFNYGTFVVDDGFYLRFVKGRMDYRLGVERYGRFQNLYLRQGRALKEQVFNLSPEDVRAMAEHLEWNAQPENATYAYDFFRDNCATRVIAVLQEVFGERLQTNCPATDSTYLEALRPFTAGNPWSAWGMELILGAEASTAMPECGHAFLPDVLASRMTNMTLDGQPLTFPVDVIYPHQGHYHAGLPPGDAGRNAPVWLMWGWALWTLVCWRLGSKASLWRRVGRQVSTLVTSVVSSAMALLFVLMALATNHNDTWWNADMIWTVGGWGALWVMCKSRRGTRVAEMKMERLVAIVWSVLALVSVLVVPAMRSNLGWGASVVWASVGACVSVVATVWTSLHLEVKK